ncbi:transcription factor LBX2 [Pseudophryne corroboree]|uniref:transcription factor LBX2 n=1 Tax=Pseudophryne corroboree TaxID=495146 RepID=UPI0030813AE1
MLHFQHQLWGLPEREGGSMSAGGEMKERRRGLMDPTTKPLTPFSIEDILSRPCVRRTPNGQGTPQHLKLPCGGARPGGPPLSSPLCALEELASKTFQGLELTVLQAAEGRDQVSSYGHRPTSKKRRKSRTAFTNHQIYELEKRFLYQKYLSPADRDHIAQQLGLSNAQVITWFQNRRAKLKRDLEEMKADVESLKKLPPHDLEKLVSMPEVGLEEDDDDTIERSCSPNSQGLFLQSPRGSSMERTADEFSEEEEIEVDD